MSLIKRGDVWHYDFQLGGDRFRGTTGETVKKKAEAFEAERRAEAKRTLKLGGHVERAPLTLRQVTDKWFAVHMADKKSAIDTARRIKILFRHIDPDLPVSAIGPREVTDAIMQRRVEATPSQRKRPLAKGEKPRPPRYPSNATVNRDLIDSTLRPILNFAEEQKEDVQRIIWAKHRLKEPKGRTRNFTAEELAAWRAELPEWHHSVFDFIARYGVRLEEVFFPPSAVNVEAGEITLWDTKNDTDHALQILPEDMPELAARKARAQAAGLDTIWFKEKGGRLHPTTYWGFESASRKARDRAGVANARPVHDLRHHAATTLYRQTGNIKLVGDLLNHKSVISSARYAHTNKADLKKALSQTYGTKTTTNNETEAETPVESTRDRGF